MQMPIVFSFIILMLAAEVSAHDVVPSISHGQVQIFFSLIGMLTCLLGSLWLVTKLVMQRKATKAGLHIVTATPVGYQKRVVIVDISGNSRQKKENPI
ncbi:MAG TPA: hypothetical protein VIM43_01570 [Rugosibacter sp.]